MTRQAKKSANTPLPQKRPPAFQWAKSERLADKKTQRMAGDFSAAEECTDICSDNINALVESGSVATSILHELRHEMVENCNRTLSVLTEISQEAFACKTINDIVELQSSAIQRVCENYFDITNNLSGMLFNSYAKAFAPINRRAAMASYEMRKAIAA